MQLNFKRKLQVDQAVVVKTGSTYARLARSYKLYADPSRCVLPRKRTVIGEVTPNFELAKPRGLLRPHVRLLRRGPPAARSLSR